MIEKFLGFIVAVQITFLFGCYILVQKCGPCAYISPPPPTQMSDNYSQSSATDDNNETLIIVATPTYKRVSRFIFFIFQ